MIQITLFLSRETLKKGGLIIHHFLTTCCFLLILLFTSCNPKSDKSNILVSVDIEANINNMKPVTLSRFTDNIRYVPLDNIEYLPLIGLNHVDISGNLILVDNGNICLLYDSEGHFISKIGGQGMGPGEYLGVINMEFGKDQEIYLSYLYDLLEYNIDGSFIKKYTKSLLIDNKYLLQTWHSVDDSLFLGHIPNQTGQIEYKAIIVDKRGNVKHYYRNYDLFNREREIGSFAEGFSHIYKFNGSIFYKELYNDTLFSLNDKYELIPRYYFQLGNLKMPVSVRAEGLMGDKLWNYISIWDVFQTENYLLLNCMFGHRFPAKRITPKPSPYPGGGLIWINTNYVLGIYNKTTGELVFCQPSNTDNPLFTTGINNDIDCGPRFFPTAMINDSTLLMWVSADKLKNHVASDDFKNNIPKYPEKKKELEKLSNSLSVFDNPVLMFVTFNKER